MAAYCLLQAPAHRFKHTARTIESALGMSVVELFEYIDTRPVASGSIGQIHRARLSPRGAALTGERAHTCVCVCASVVCVCVCMGTRTSSGRMHAGVCLSEVTGGCGCVETGMPACLLAEPLGGVFHT